MQSVFELCTLNCSSYNQQIDLGKITNKMIKNNKNRLRRQKSNK